MDEETQDPKGTDVFVALLIFVVLIALIMAPKIKMPAYKALTYIWIGTWLLNLALWKRDPLLCAAGILSGMLSALTPIFILFGALSFFKIMDKSGALAVVRAWLKTTTPDPIGQVMVIGWAFVFFIEGSSGFGTPGAIAAPLLSLLGIPPVKAAIICLSFDSVPVVFGAVGTPFFFGFSRLIDNDLISEDELIKTGYRASLMVGAAALPIVLLGLWSTFTWREIGQRWKFILASVFSCILPYIGISFASYEFPTMVGGLVGLATTLLLAKYRIGFPKEKEKDDKADLELPTIGHDELGEVAENDAPDRPSYIDAPRRRNPLHNPLRINTMLESYSLGFGSFNEQLHARQKKAQKLWTRLQELLLKRHAPSVDPRTGEPVFSLDETPPATPRNSFWAKSGKSTSIDPTAISASSPPPPPDDEILQDSQETPKPETKKQEVTPKPEANKQATPKQGRENPETTEKSSSTDEDESELFGRRLTDKQMEKRPLTPRTSSAPRRSLNVPQTPSAFKKVLQSVPLGLHSRALEDLPTPPFERKSEKVLAQNRDPTPTLLSSSATQNSVHDSTRSGNRSRSPSPPRSEPFSLSQSKPDRKSYSDSALHDLLKQSISAGPIQEENAPEKPAEVLTPEDSKNLEMIKKLLSKLYTLSEGEETELATERAKDWRQVLRAFSPFLIIVVLILVTRIEVLQLRSILQSDATSGTLSLGTLGKFKINPAIVIQLQNIFGTTKSWKISLLYIPFVIPFVLAGLFAAGIYLVRPSVLLAQFKNTALQISFPSIAIISAVIFVEQLQVEGGFLSVAQIIGTFFGDLVGKQWAVIAYFVGVLGAFFAGSATVSNLVFSPTHFEVALQNGIELSSVLSTQAAGAALGNMVCILNIVAVSVVLSLGPESTGTILKWTSLPLCAATIIIIPLSFLVALF